MYKLDNTYFNMYCIDKMSKSIFEYQNIVLGVLKERLVPFYLAGGTALAKFYFQHRESYDLDFFTQDYSIESVRKIAQLIEKATGKKMKLIQETAKEGMAKLAIYDCVLNKRESLKIDFVQDVQPLIGPLKKVDGIDVLSLDDIYLRKIHAVSGVLPQTDRIGRVHFSGGREEAKDFYDVYLLSSAYQRLSEFAARHCDDLQKEALIRWYHVYSRSEIKMGLIELKERNPIEFVVIERHFKREINRLIEELLP